MRRWARALAFAPLMTVLIAGGSFAQDGSVRIAGEVRRPGSYPIGEAGKLSALIVRAGGYTDNAWLRGGTLARRSERAREEPVLRGLVSRIERRTFATPGNEGPKREFVDRLSRLEPLGLVPVRLAHPRLLKGSPDDLPLENDDVVTVPSKTAPVTVAGAVKRPGVVPLPTPETDPETLIRAAGGFSENADRAHAYLLRADGAAVPLSRKWIRWNAKESRWEIPAFVEKAPRAEPGDMIVVPRKPARAFWAHEVPDLQRLLMEIHALTGVRVDPP